LEEEFMKVLVVGGGGREHALVWKLRQSPRVKEIYCAPGNAGISEEATCVPIGAEDVPALLSFAGQQAIDLTLVGPEGPLTAGIVDVFQEAGLRVFGPARAAAAIEESKVLAKELMTKYNIPSARYAVFDDPDQAAGHIKANGAPCVVKADGLAAGKGVIVAGDEETALDAVRSIMVDRVFGAAGRRVVIEELLTGEELSILAFTDGTAVVPMVPSQDHKRAFDGDRGPNTGGMGAYAPVPLCTDKVYRQALDEILTPLIRGMALEGRTYRGVIYAGLMLTAEGPKVLEFNARFGDPEAQPVLSLLETDLVEIIEAVLAGRLEQMEILWKKGAAVCVVLASAGYPGAYQKGKVIHGLADMPPGIKVFHAGTARRGDEIVTDGGRVLGVTAVAGSISEAVDEAYAAAERVYFDGIQFRRDIAYRARQHS